MTQPKLSVIIPTLNEEKNIVPCLQSLQNQKLTLPYEIIIVDHNSHDQTTRLASEFPYVRIVNEAKRGKATARIRGATEAKAPLLCFTEADCVLPSTWLQTIYTTLHSPHVIGVTGPYLLTHSTLFLKTLVALLLPLTSFLFRLIYGHFAFRGTNFAIKKNILNHVGGFNPDHQEFDDVELSLRAHRLGHIIYSPRLIVHTSDRRFKNRLPKFLKEFTCSYFKQIVLRQPLTDKIYEDIR